MRRVSAIATVLLALALALCIFGSVVVPLIFIITTPPGGSGLTVEEVANGLKGEYGLRLDALEAQLLREKFVQSTLDQETHSYIAECMDEWIERPHQRAFKHYIWDVLTTVGLCMTAANGIAGVGNMFVVSSEEVRQLVAKAWTNRSSRGQSLLDIGANNGAVTAAVAEGLDILPTHIVAVEVSLPMVFKLRQRGYRVVQDWLELASEHNEYDVVLCLNIIDRIDDPVGLLDFVHRSTKRDGLVILAIVLPLCDGIETCGVQDGRLRKPLKPLPDMEDAKCSDGRFEYKNGSFFEGQSDAVGTTFEHSFEQFATVVLPKAGFEIVNFTKVPYLCCGDLNVDLMVLPNAVFALKPVPKI